MHTLDSFDRFWVELEKREFLGIDSEILRKILEKVLSREFNLKLIRIEETERKDLRLTCSDKLGKDVVAIVRVGEERAAVERDDVEDLYSDMVEAEAFCAVFLTDAYYTKEAKDFAKDLPIKLLDRQDLSNLIYEVELYKKQKAFVSEIDDEYVKRYFKAKLKSKLTNLILRLPDKLEEIDRRYMPIGFFSLRKVVGDVEKRKYAYIDLSSGDLYYIDEGYLRKNDLFRRILSLPPEARNLLLELVKQGDLPYDTLDKKALSVLIKNNFLVVSSKKRGGGGIMWEIGALTSFIVAELAEFIGIRRGEYGLSPEKKEVKYAGAVIKMPSLEHPYDLERFLEVDKIKEGFDADPERYKPEEIVSLLTELTGAEVSYNYTVYLPYYVAKYRGPQGVAYERKFELKFKPFFPKPGTYSFVYHIIDRFPDFPYIVIGLFYVAANMNQSDKLLHVFASSFIFVVFALLVGLTLKGIFRTERTTPFYASRDYGVPLFRYGFPSLHSLASAGAVSFTYFIDPMGHILSILMIPIAALYIYSRIRIGAHSRTDVVGGAIIGFILGLIGGIVILSIHLPYFLQIILTVLTVFVLLMSIILRLAR